VSCSSLGGGGGGSSSSSHEGGIRAAGNSRNNFRVAGETVVQVLPNMVLFSAQVVMQLSRLAGFLKEWLQPSFRKTEALVRTIG